MPHGRLVRAIAAPPLIGVALGVRGAVLVVDFSRRSTARALDMLVGTVVDAVVRRVDFVGIAEDVVEAVDLPEIIRRSTGAVASDFVHQARMRGARADDAVARVRNRGRGDP
jgi:hypothetical protein